MARIIVALVLAGCAAGTAAATDKGDVMAVVHQYVDGINRGDTQSRVAVCADHTFIIDDFPPHVWDGADACAKWANDFDALAKKIQITDGVLKLGKPWHLDVTGDRAYVVLPTSVTYKLAGKPRRTTGSLWTFALQKTAAGWRITGLAWATGKDSAVATEPAH
jgi:ketosteroid isomerase-like protein